MTIQEAIEEAKSISKNNDYYIVETYGVSSEHKVEFHHCTVIIDGINASSLPSFEECFEFHRAKSPSLRENRIAELRRELTRLEGRAKVPPGVEDARD